MAQMSLIQRFSLRTELYDKILEDASGLERLDIFLRPLFHQAPDKIYNLNKAMELQRPVRKKQTDEEEEILDFDEEKWQEELARQKREKLAKYEKSLAFLLDFALDKGNVSLQEIQEGLTEEEKNILIPDVDIFKEIMVELIKSREINIAMLKKEKSEYIVEQTLDFQLHEMILELVERDEQRKGILRIFITRLEDGKVVEFTGIPNETGQKKTIRCSNVRIMIEK